MAHGLEVALLGLALQGCTLIGGGIGAGIDSTRTTPWEERTPAAPLEPGDRVLLAMRSGRLVEGFYAGTVPPTAHDSETYIVLDRDAGRARFATSDVRSVWLEVPGKGWLVGICAGLTLDLLFTAMFAPQLSITGAPAVPR